MEITVDYFLIQINVSISLILIHTQIFYNSSIYIRTATMTEDQRPVDFQCQEDTPS
jgi:hypothetical protein